MAAVVVALRGDNGGGARVATEKRGEANDSFDKVRKNWCNLLSVGLVRVAMAGASERVQSSSYSPQI